LPHGPQLDPISVLGVDPTKLDKELFELFQTNCVGNIHLFNLVMPLVLKGSVKKVITISSGHADPIFAEKFGVYESAQYAISKAAMNMAVAKFHAEYAEKGVLFMSIGPGYVDFGQYDNSKF
jgi:NAD(P)-dependent dehydrogenase (short-subunit alcohol dehydrogenase family)